MRLVIISDTHLQPFDPPDGDLLVHCGDLTLTGTADQLARANEQFARVRRRYTHGILCVAGNHDWLFERDPARARSLVTEATYLQDEGVSISGLTCWGSPWCPQFFDWAFMDDDDRLGGLWRKIPTTTKVLITHTPPFGIRDLSAHREHSGSRTLRAALGRVRPSLHCFGHIHEGYGEMRWNGTRYVNASLCDAAYRSINPPIVADV